MKLTDVTPDFIENLSYTSFIGLINQWNVPPGAYSTVVRWITNSAISATSNLVEVACSTGFSLREIALLTGCTGVGVDKCVTSIASARINKERYAPNTLIEYHEADALSFAPCSPATHVVVGASLKFFEDPKRMLTRAVSWFSGSGFILASPFWVSSPVPISLVRRAEVVFGIQPTNVGYKEVMALYKELELFYEEKFNLERETGEELMKYCSDTIERACTSNPCLAPLSEKLYERLLRVRSMSNELRPYQKYSVAIFRFRKETHPSRFVELF